MPLIHGMPWFPGTTQEMIDTFPRLSARQNDIFVATYTKAGKYNDNLPAAGALIITLRPSGEKPGNKCWCERESLLFRVLSCRFARRLDSDANARSLNSY